MTTYKMKKTQSGVKAGDVHPSVFHEGKHYEVDDDLASQFKDLDAVEESASDAVETPAKQARDDLHENWLDTDPAVLRHGELTAAEVIARDESPLSEGAVPAAQEAGKAEGEATGDESEEDPDEADPEGGPKGKKRRK